MFRKVLVGYLDAEHGVDALALGRKLASACGAPLEVATAPDPEGQDFGQVARSRGADLLVLGSSHRAGLGRVVPGTTVDHLLAEPPCAIAVAPPGFGRPSEDEPRWRPLDGNGDDAGMRVIGIGYEASPTAGAALRLATELALRNQSALRVYTVARKIATLSGADDPAFASGAREADWLRDELGKAVRGLPPEVRAQPVFLRGFEDAELIKAAALGVDLLVLGSRPGGPLRRRLQRSVSNLVLAKAPCPVLIVPAAVAAAVPAPA